MKILLVLLIFLIKCKWHHKLKKHYFDTYPVLHFPKYVTSQLLVQFQALETQTEDGCEIQDVPAFEKQKKKIKL